jgi:hypothetical protein
MTVYVASCREAWTCFIFGQWRCHGERPSFTVSECSFLFVEIQWKVRRSGKLPAECCVYIPAYIFHASAQRIYWTLSYDKALRDYVFHLIKMSSDLKTIFNAPETFVIQAPPQCRKCRTYRKYRHPKFKILIPYIGVYAPPQWNLIRLILQYFGRTNNHQIQIID